MNSPTNQNGIPLVLLIPCGHYPAGIWPWAKIQIVPPVNIPIPTKIGSKLGGEFTYQAKWDPIGFTNLMWTLPPRNMAMGQNPNRTPSEHHNPEFTYQPKWDPIGFTNPMWTLPRRNMAMGQNPNRTPSEHPNPHQNRF